MPKNNDIKKLASLTFPIWGTVVIFLTSIQLERACATGLAELVFYIGIALVVISAYPIFTSENNFFLQLVIVIIYYLYASFSFVLIGYITGSFIPNHYCVS